MSVLICFDWQHIYVTCAVHMKYYGNGITYVLSQRG